MIFFTKESKTKRLINLTAQKIKELKSKLQILDQDLTGLSTNIKKKLFTKHDAKLLYSKAEEQLDTYIEEYELVKKDERTVKYLINSIEDFQIKFKLENQAKILGDSRYKLSENLFYLKRKLYNISKINSSGYSFFTLVIFLIVLICLTAYFLWNRTNLFTFFKKFLKNK